MRITNIKYDGKYHVTLKYNWIEKLFGYKDKVKQYKPTGNQFIMGYKNNIYTDADGNRTGNGDTVALAIDKWELQQNW